MWRCVFAVRQESGAGNVYALAVPEQRPGSSASWTNASASRLGREPGLL